MVDKVHSFKEIPEKVEDMLTYMCTTHIETFSYREPILVILVIIKPNIEQKWDGKFLMENTY